ncbi:S24 family peptidase [Delftia acidovorans]|uniref:LexA family protein n=1 Tax=Delftia acidovorans TaxID=80866 RepID=UPI002FDCFE8B
MHPVTERIYQAVAHLTGKASVGPTDVSQFLGLANSQTAKNWETRGPSSDGLVAAAERGINMRWMKYGEGTMEDRAPLSQTPRPAGVTLVPLISSVQAGNWSEIVDRLQTGDAERWLPCPVRHGPNTFCLAVEGESMSNPGVRPSYEPGDIIFVDPGRAAQPGDRVVVRLDNQQQATFKQYLEEDGRKFLRALNPDWKPRLTSIDGAATICGVVIGKWVPEIE